MTSKGFVGMFFVYLHCIEVLLDPYLVVEDNDFVTGWWVKSHVKGLGSQDTQESKKWTAKIN